ncbi:MAG TPA: biotin/lipoyl-containing protein, partial [Paraburkholderia sp.]|nr:biotin/lipoyl-containing protein [Paraburkholderia sp.]
MAIVEVKVPQLSESVSEATMLQWKKKPGEAVAQDEILIEIETDKVVLEVPAPSAGVLAQVIKNDGDIVVADEVIAKIDTEGTAGAAAIEAEVKPAPAATAAPAPAAAPAAQAASATGANTAASPAAAKLLAEKNLSAGDVAGSGRDGRITKGDVLTAGAAPAPKAPAAAPAAAPMPMPVNGRPVAAPAIPPIPAPAAVVFAIVAASEPLSLPPMTFPSASVVSVPPVLALLGDPANETMYAFGRISVS